MTRFERVIELFNRIMMERNLLDDYAIGGAVALAYYIEPRDTQDLDLYLLVSDDQYHKLWETLIEMGFKSEGQRVIIYDVPVDLFPVSIGPIFKEALSKSKKIFMGGLPVKIFPSEYLVVTKLMAHRYRDKEDVHRLFERRVVSSKIVSGLIRRFDDEKKTLAKRLKEILG